MSSNTMTQYLRARLKAALDASDVATITDLVAALFSTEIAASEARDICRWWASDGRGLVGVEACLKKTKGVSITTNWSLDEARAKAWLRQRISVEDSLRQIYTDDFDVMVELCRAIDVAHATAEWRRQHPDELPPPVLITGETGTGKELLACAMHAMQVQRLRELGGATDADGFAPINCAGMPGELIESELFGYEKGAFTGAKKEGSPGLIEQHARGTVFLDEIGDAPPEVQVKLLRVLNNGEVRKIGSHHAKKVFPWLMAATHRTVALEVTRGRFREDLHNRLLGHEFRLKPLRDRGSDRLGALVACIRRYARRPDLVVDLAPSAIAAMNAYSWPGNLRKIDMFARRVVQARPLPRAGGVHIQLEDLPDEVQHHYVTTSRSLDVAVARYADLARELAAEDLQDVRANLVRTFETSARAGALRETLGIQVIRVVARTPLAKMLSGDKHRAVLQTVEHHAAKSHVALVAELQAGLATIDGVNVATNEPTTKVSRGVPKWLDSAMTIAGEWSTSAAGVDLASKVGAALQTVPAPVREAGQQLLMTVLAAGNSELALPSGDGATLEELRADRRKLEVAIKKAGSKSAFAREHGITDRTLRRWLNDLAPPSSRASGRVRTQKAARPDVAGRRRSSGKRERSK